MIRETEFVRVLRAGICPSPSPPERIAWITENVAVAVAQFFSGERGLSSRFITGQIKRREK